MRTIGWMRGGLVALACLVAAPASADIKSFNAAMQAKDYRKAAAEAASTWPTLDKSRTDLAIIAREFGFAAYLSGDYAAAKSYGEAAVSSGAAEVPELRAGSDILLRLAEHKLTPTDASRDVLYAALNARAALPGTDLVSYFAADAITGYDFQRGDWKDAVASAIVSEKLAVAGGALYLPQAYQFGLFKSVAEYMDTRERKSFDDVSALKNRLVRSINAAASDDAAKPLVDFYWDVAAWEMAIGSHLVGRRKMKWPTEEEDDAARADLISDRTIRLLGWRDDEDPCSSTIDMRRDPQYPSSALYKGIIGVVMVRVDIDAQGKASNPVMLSAVPEKYFGEAVLKSVKDIRYKPGDRWGANCSLAYPGRVVTFQFMIGG